MTGLGIAKGERDHLVLRNLWSPSFYPRRNNKDHNKKNEKVLVPLSFVIRQIETLPNSLASMELL